MLLGCLLSSWLLCGLCRLLYRLSRLLCGLIELLDVVPHHLLEMLWRHHRWELDHVRLCLLLS